MAVQIRPYVEGATGRGSVKPPISDLTGSTHGQQTVLHFVGRDSHSMEYWLCRCVCGSERAVQKGSLLRRGGGCGCQPWRTHGMSKTITYTSWRSMMSRCYYPRDIGFHKYGGDGVVVCSEWHKFEAFLADMGPRPTSRHSIDRFPDSTGSYERGNCRWATRQEQNNNRTYNKHLVYKGERRTIAEWFGQPECLCASYTAFRQRISAGWSAAKAIETPVRKLTRKQQPT